MNVNQMWKTIFGLVKKITGDVDVKNKGTLQDQIDNISATDVGLDKVGNYKAVSTESGQGLSDTEKSNARTNIGAGTSSFSGSYTDLTNKPTIPAAVAVKGNEESSYRTGNVNLTPANLGALSTTGDSKDNTVSFTSADSTTATAWTDVSTLTSGEKHSSILNKISTMFKNIRYLNSMVSTLNSKINRFLRNYTYCPQIISGQYISLASKSLRPHRPYIVRLIIFNLLFVPSTKPLLKSLATAFSTADISLSNPFAKDDISLIPEFVYLSIKRYSNGIFFVWNISLKSRIQHSISHRISYLFQSAS